MPLDQKTRFARQVLFIVRNIPIGKVSTYGDVATLAGHPNAWRAVGNIMRNCSSPAIPCHRVVGSGGQIGGYSNTSLKHQLLKAEGILIAGTRIKNFNNVRWNQKSIAFQ
tara:strand:+ start:3421 stop:3750 length:330 start_codon:yes stop_codon:yes gene_type:complete